MRHLPAPSPGAPVEVAFAIGRRVGGAVVRNRIRRRLRAHLHDLHRRSHIPPGAYLVVVSPGGDQLDHHQLGRHLRAALERLAGGG